MKRLILPLLVVAALSGACSSGDDGATVTAGGDASDAARDEPTADSTTTTAATAPQTTATAPPATTTSAAAPPPTVAPSPATTTTTRPAPATTTTTFPPDAVRLTIVNEHPRPVDLSVNGTSYALTPGQRLGPVPVIPAPDHNDGYSAVVHGTDCGLGDGGPHFQKGPGTSVTMRLVPFGDCEPAGPGVPNLSIVFEGDWSGGH